MTLVGIRAVHPWIDSKMRVIGYPQIKTDASFVQSRLVLSQVINSIVQHFQLNPPKQLVIVDAGLKRLQDSLNASAGPSNGSAGAGGLSNGYNSSSSNGHSNSNSNSNGHGHAGASSRVYQSQTPAPPVPADEPEPYKLPPHFTQIITLSTSDQQQQHATIVNLDLPKAPTRFQELDSMERSEMNTILNDTKLLIDPSSKFNLSHQSIVQEMEALKQTLTESNSAMAEDNLEAQIVVKGLYDEVNDLQMSLKDKVDQVNNLQRRQMDLCKPMKMDKIMIKLKKAKKKSFEESEELAHNWLNDTGDKEVFEFLEEFLEVRTVHHVRNAKMERLNAL